MEVFSVYSRARTSEPGLDEFAALAVKMYVYHYSPGISQETMN